MNRLWNNLSKNFNKSSFESSIESRYELFTAHATGIRFRARIKNSEKLLRLTDTFREYDFGALNCNTLELVYNDGYQRVRLVKLLHRFNFK